MFRCASINKTLCLSLIRHFETCNTTDKRPNNAASQFEYGQDIQKRMNAQITNEMFASYSYLSIATYFARTDIGLGGCSGFFLGLSDEEQQHAHKLMKYQIMRGGIVQLNEISKPEKTDWASLSMSLKYAIELERDNTKSLLDLYKIAESANDLMLMDFLTAEYLHEQVNI